MKTDTMKPCPDPAVPATDPEAGGRLPWWWIPSVLFLVAVLLGLFLAQPQERPEQRSIYDAGDKGTRAAYLLLEELGYPVKASRRLVQGQVRWVLFPNKNVDKAGPVADWVRTGGGVLVLADDSGEFAQAIGLPVQTRRASGRSQARPILVPPEDWKVYPGRTIVTGPTRGQPGFSLSHTWPAGAKEPLASVYSLGRGQVWLLNRPGLLSNEQLRASRNEGAGNALVVCQLAEACRPDPGATIWFDEYHHGLRDRPGVIDLLWQRPLRWATLQSLVLLALVLWRQVPRFGALSPLPAARRRSKEEYLDALAHLLERKRAYADAVETVRLALVRHLERSLGLPAGTPIDILVNQASRAWGRRRPGRSTSIGCGPRWSRSGWRPAANPLLSTP